MLTNTIATFTRRGVGYSQTTGRRTAETARVLLQNAKCLVGQSKNRRITYSDGIREMVKPAYALTLETYESVTFQPGDQVEITMRDSSTSETYTVEDAILSVGIRRKVWKMTIERIKVAAENE